jgi:dTDP-4-dehydrorhamnose reductase
MTKKKVIVIGSKGMAGHVILQFLKETGLYDLVDISRDASFFPSSYHVDLSRLQELDSIVRAESPDVVINCVGILNQVAEQNPDSAVFFNSYFPHFLAKAGKRNQFKLIHISTDCVFSGKKGSYKEDDLKDGIGFYAQSKALGEVNYDNHLTLRTSIIGPELKTDGIGLFHWFMKQKGEVKGFTKAYWSGITTIELAKGIHSAINEDLSGLYHLVNGEKISKYELLYLINNAFDRELTIVPCDKYEVDKSLVNSRDDFSYRVGSYAGMVSELRDWITGHAHLYRHQMAYNFSRDKV